MLSLGGGAVTHAPTRAARRRLRACRSRCCTPPLDTLLARVGDGRTRPLLADDPPGRLARAGRRTPADLRRARHAERRHRAPHARPGRRAHRRPPARAWQRSRERDHADPGRGRRAVRRARRHGTARRAAAPPLGRRHAGRDRAPADAARRAAEAVRDDLGASGYDAHVIEVPDGEDAKTLQVAGSLLGRARRARLHPLRRDRRARRGSDHRPRRLGRGGLAARRARRAGADHAGRHGRRRDRRQDRHQHRARQEPGRRVPPAGRVLCDLNTARDAAGRPTTSPGWPRWSSAASSPTRRSST